MKQPRLATTDRVSVHWILSELCRKAQSWRATPVDRIREASRTGMPNLGSTAKVIERTSGYFGFPMKISGMLKKVEEALSGNEESIQ